MRAGNRIFSTLMQQIAAASAVIVVVSRASGQSQYVDREVDVALQHGKLIIPILLNEPNNEDPLNFLLRGIHRIDALSWARLHARSAACSQYTTTTAPPLDNLRREDLGEEQKSPRKSVCRVIPPCSVSGRWFMWFWGKMILAVLVVLSLVFIGFSIPIGWNRPLRNVPDTIWMHRPLYSGPRPVPLTSRRRRGASHTMGTETTMKLEKDLTRNYLNALR